LETAVTDEWRATVDEGATCFLSEEQQALDKIGQANTLEQVHSIMEFPELGVIKRTRIAGRGGFLGDL
jgi:hypothetical protein